MIVVKIIGGLGNQLFQYAVARHIAQKHNSDLILDISAFTKYKLRNYSLYHFNINGKVDESTFINIKNKSKFLKFMNRIFLRKPALTYVGEKNFHFDDTILCLPDNIYLDGYWQSEKYFKGIEAIIREEFAIKTCSDKTNMDIASQIQDCSAVSLHIRRGDYISNSTTQAFHGVCTLDYYKNAVTEIASKSNNPVFYIFSDDIEWARNNIKLDFPTVFIGHNGPEKDYEDLRLMSLCKNHIIANSTFSWWGAWLSSYSDKIVCAPKRWFAVESQNARDILPPSWIKL